MTNKTNNQPIVNVNPQMGEDNPAVLAYRVGQLEKAAKEGFRAVTEELRTMGKNFATHKDIEVAKEQARLEHEAIYREIEELKGDVMSLRKKTWVQNTLSAILGAVLTLLLTYTISNVLAN